MIQLFQAGHGRFSNNYTAYKESYVPMDWPGGGGWSIFQLSLSSLYSQNQLLMNWWTKSNKGLNLCRYKGCRFRFYRQEKIDYVVQYSNEYPFDVGKYHYPSFHPQRQLIYNHKIIVPSLQTQPLKKKKYITKWIKPPREMIDKWYFQQHFQQFPLVMIAATACSLNNMFGPSNKQSNNVYLWALNTKFFTNKGFQYAAQTTGYKPNNNHWLYATNNGTHIITEIQQQNVIFLGDSMNYFEGQPRNGGDINSYNKLKWGNPFMDDYLHGTKQVFISAQNYTTLLTAGGSTKVESTQWQKKTEPLIQICVYNPNKDDGNGNEAYWVDNITTSTNWDESGDPDLKITGFPLWVLLWGWEDWTKKLGKIKNINQDYCLVVKTKYIDPPMPGYVFLSDSFVNGQGPYHQHKEEISDQDLKHWYPRWRYQKEEIEKLLMSGPSVCRAEGLTQIQAHCKYDFFFKWGGNPSTMQQVYDPTAQPTYPTPGGLQQTNEIINPASSIQSYIYTWDVRRDLLTQKATKRIKEDPTNDSYLFTDGSRHSKQNIDITPQERPPQETMSSEEEEEETIQSQLQLYKQRNRDLRNRYRQLKQIMDSLS